MKKTLSRLHFFQRYLYLVFSVVALLMCVVLVIRFFLVSPGKVNGRSMEPGYMDEQVFFVNKFVYLFEPPKRFDIVQMIDPKSEKLMMKRVIGLPGDVIVIKRGFVYKVNKETGEEERVSESAYLGKGVYTKVWAQTKPERYVLGQNEYFVLGDNRDHSVDSRDYGPVHRSVIIGKVMDRRD